MVPTVCAGNTCTWKERNDYKNMSCVSMGFSGPQVRCARKTGACIVTQAGSRPDGGVPCFLVNQTVCLVNFPLDEELTEYSGAFSPQNMPA